MNLLTLGILIAVFIFGTLLAFSFSLLFAESKYLKKRAVKKRLLYMSSGAWHGQEKFAAYRERVLANANPFVRLAFKLPRINKLNKMILAAGMDVNPWIFILASITLGAIGILAGFIIPKKIPGIEILSAILFAFLPYIFLLVKINMTKKKFLEQFPEALDLLSRALRSGHAFTSALAMVTDQMDAPIKNEFGSIVDEVNFGLSLKEALLNMCERVPVTDLRFFAVAVLIQSETGGNIAEVMDNISHIMRERVQFKRQVNSLTAEGRVSAIILMALPVVMFFYLYFTNYAYVSLLWQDQLGQKMLACGIGMQIIGAIVLMKMVDIES
jgi:tight adherence protein B